MIGRLGKNPKIVSLKDKDDKKVASFSVATSESWMNKKTGERDEKTEWHNVSVFNQSIIKGILPHVKKGSKVYLEGSLHTRKWIDKKDNIERYSTEIHLGVFNSDLKILNTIEDSESSKAEESEQYFEDTQENRAKMQENRERTQERTHTSINQQAPSDREIQLHRNEVERENRARSESERFAKNQEESDSLDF